MEKRMETLSQKGLNILSEMEKLEVYGGGGDSTKGGNVSCSHGQCVNKDCNHGTCSHTDCTNGTCNDGYCVNGYEIG